MGRKKFLKRNLKIIICIIFFILVYIGVEYGIVSMVGLLLFVPVDYEIFTKNGGYKGANKRSSENPLYVKNYFRKNKGSIIWARLKGFWICQFAMAIVIILSLSNGLRYGFHSLSDVIFWKICMVILGLRCMFYLYYMWCYDRGCRYLENKRGVWQPFYAMLKTYHNGYRRDLRFQPCTYEVMRKSLILKLEEERYQLEYQYAVDQKTGRNRLPVIVYGLEANSFEQIITFGCLGSREDQKKYSKLKRELLSVLDSALKIW